MREKPADFGKGYIGLKYFVCTENSGCFKATKTGNLIFVPKFVSLLNSLIYFDDVDLSDWPKLLYDIKLTWQEIKILLR